MLMYCHNNNNNNNDDDDDDDSRIGVASTFFRGTNSDYGSHSYTGNVNRFNSIYIDSTLGGGYIEE